MNFAFIGWNSSLKKAFPSSVSQVILTSTDQVSSIDPVQQTPEILRFREIKRFVSNHTVTSNKRLLFFLSTKKETSIFLKRTLQHQSTASQTVTVLEHLSTFTRTRHSLGNRPGSGKHLKPFHFSQEFN